MFNDKKITEAWLTDNSSLSKEEIKEVMENHFFSWADLPKKERKITEIFKKHKSKFSENNKGLFLHPAGHVYEPEDFRIFFEYEKEIPLKEKKEYNFVYDCLNFVCYEKDLQPALNENEYIKKILYDFSLLNEKGTLMLLMDIYYTKNFFNNLIKALGTDYKTKLFINFYFMEKYDLLFIITIQKMSKVENPINLSETKVLITDYFSNIYSHLLCSKPIGDINTFLEECFKKIENYYIQNKINYALLKVLHPGKFFQVRLKASPLNTSLDFIVTVCDNSINLDCKNVRTTAVVLLYEMTQELCYNPNNSFDMMSRILNVGRLIILECALLKPLGMNAIAFELAEDIEMMKPREYKDKVHIQGWEDKNQKYLVYQGDNFLIRDCEEKQDFIFRELFYTTDEHIQNAIMSKIKIKFVSKSKIKNNDNSSLNFPMETQDKFKSKGVIKCIDENYVSGFFEKAIICMSFYLDLRQYPKNTLKFLDIGAGLGIMSFYFHRFFKGNCEVDNIEKNKWMYDIGIKYFGLKNYVIHQNRVNWYFEEAHNCINKMINSHEKKYENKIGFYDLIFNEVNDINKKEDTSPPSSFFEDEFLSNIKKLLKKNGIYIINIQSNNFKPLYDNLLKLRKHFPTCYIIPSETGLSSVIICYRDEISEEKYGEMFNTNKDIILTNDLIDSAIIEPFYKEVISKIKDINEEIKKLEDNSRKV